MKTIEINKGGFGLASLFAGHSTKESLHQQSDMDGKYLDELGITYSVGDTFVLKEPLSPPSVGHKLHYLKVHAVSEDKYECEFVSKEECFAGMAHGILKS